MKNRSKGMGKLVAYYRVSARKQGESGLGLEAQQACVVDFARYGQHEIIAAYQEVETGKRADRPELRHELPSSRGVGGPGTGHRLPRIDTGSPTFSLPPLCQKVRGNRRCFMHTC